MTRLRAVYHASVSASPQLAIVGPRTECQSIRGTWGGICPDCGQLLPVRLPWGHGRPCDRASGLNGNATAGRPSNAHRAAQAWGHPSGERRT